MPALIAISILLVASVVIWALRIWQPKPGYQWLIALGSAISSWLLVFLLRPQLPLSLTLSQWLPDTSIFASPSLLVDQVSWPFAVAVSTITLSVILTDVANVGAIEPNTWSASLAVGGIGLLAVLSGNPLTLLLTWSVIDIAETWILLEQVSSSEERVRVVVSFAVQIAGMFLLAYTLINRYDFANIPQNVSIFLLLASGFRLGIIPPHGPFLTAPPLRRGLGTMVRLVPVAASLVLLARTASTGLSESWVNITLALSGIAVLYSSISWARARNELSGRPNWIFGMASFAFVAAVLALPGASLAWGVSLLLSGGLLFLASVRQKYLRILLLVGFLGVTALPYTPLFVGADLYANLPPIFLIVFLIAHAFLLLGFVRHSLRLDDLTEELERWVWLVYPLGLVLLPVSLILINWDSGMIAGLRPGWWGGLLALGLAAILMVVSRQLPPLSEQIIVSLGKFFSLSWLYQFAWWFYRNLGKLLNVILQIMEGDGGILWAVLIMILFVTFILQRSGGI